MTDEAKREAIEREVDFYQNKLDLVELRLKATKEVASEPFEGFGGDVFNSEVESALLDQERYAAKLAIAKGMLSLLSSEEAACSG